MENENIIESVLDPIQATRPKDVWDNETNLLLPDVKEFILKLAEDFKKSSKVPFEIYQLWMIGSSTGYQYNDLSDIDINCKISMSREEFNNKNSYTIVPKEIILPGTQRPVSFFLLYQEDSFNPDNAESIFDIKNDRWIKQGRLTKQPVPYSYIAGLATFFMDGALLRISEYERDTRELRRYMLLDPETEDITEKEKDEAINRKIIDIKNDLDSIRMISGLIWSLSVDAFENDKQISLSINYTFTQKQYNMNSLIYKYLDTFNVQHKLKEVYAEGKAFIEEAIKELKRDTAGDTIEGRDKEDSQDIVESYIDDELKEILIENGFKPTNKNIEILRRGIETGRYILDQED